MATLPRATTVLSDSEDMPMGDESLSGPEGVGGYEICIRVSMDKKLSVGVKEDGPGGEVTGPDESIVSPAPAYQPVSSIRDALTLALDIYRSNGDMAETSDADESFDAGFRRP